MTQNRRERALTRNLHEVGRAILERKAMVGMEAADSNHTVDFFRLAYDALFNDMIAHAIKVFDKNKDSNTFWYIYGCFKKEINKYVESIGYDLKKLDDVAEKLKIVRDKTHFHIDKVGVLKPDDVWKSANITGAELAQAIDMVWDILNHVYKITKGDEFTFPKYNGTDATRIIKLTIKEGVI